ncbi:hypothetical protein [Ectobacillus sp. sgz5001026]|uniref:hypothetical protein n=1 Tax=Ectobacillus sp. sgz5001026 TaxID=3242473 RepID=UPI0036D23F57
MRNYASITNSGNSNVNVDVQIDMSPVAYTMACYWHTSRTITDEQFMHMLQNLNRLLGKPDSQLPPLLSNANPSPEAIRTKNDVKTLRTFIPQDSSRTGY